MASPTGFSATNGGPNSTGSSKDKAPASSPKATTVSSTGETINHYHSYFASLVSWENPRSSAIAYASIVTFILAIRYLDVLRWTFKLTWVALGFTVAAEIAGKLVLGNGLASQFRPRKYYTVPRETLDILIGDVHDLINFFVIEGQRIFFAENVWASAAIAVAAFVSYFLVKVVPYWGLALIGTTVAFATPPLYTSNQELIDQQIKNVSDVVNAQTLQLRQAAGKHTAHATELTKQYLGNYTARAQQILGSSAAAKPATAAAPAAAPPKYSEKDFPAAPKEKPAAAAAAASSDEEDEEDEEDEPLIAA